ncbi:uncharacterized protein N7503_000598 [Penicillium pulvis]|uniref:uncharacterized protein n=1 Tax=Penicillium pulvis TaxID=1562058 RepID=UPI002548D38D|nr:uncharacterized protein N7503_000598 [Penicillium pulvis]KAJ5813848.1 hypothetical protein N7503_000598 [Penicillium pulvis]
MTTAMAKPMVATVDMLQVIMMKTPIVGDTMQNAAMAHTVHDTNFNVDHPAGAAEAFSTRKEPGEWKGDKGKHVVTAAITNGLINKDPSKSQKHHIVGTTLRGLHEGAPSREERAEIQRRVGGSHTSSNLKKAAAVGAVAFAGKELYDRFVRSRSPAQDYNNDRYRSNKRSQSVSDDWHRGTKFSDHEESDDQRSARFKDRDGQSNHGASYSRRDPDSRNWDYSSDGYSSSDIENNYHEDDYGRQRGSRDLARPRSLNSSDEKRKEKKMKRDMLLSSGLATTATHKQRMDQLEYGEITADEAREERIKSNRIDEASIGLTALGIKGAYGEWKAVNEKR